MVCHERKGKLGCGYFPGESFGALVCCNRRRFEETFCVLEKEGGTECRGSRGVKRGERGKGTPLHPHNVTWRLDFGLKIPTNLRQFFKLPPSVFFPFRISAKKLQPSFLTGPHFYSTSES
jgi:hypothetical protein